MPDPLVPEANGVATEDPDALDAGTPVAPTEDEPVLRPEAAVLCHVYDHVADDGDEVGNPDGGWALPLVLTITSEDDCPVPGRPDEAGPELSELDGSGTAELNELTDEVPIPRGGVTLPEAPDTAELSAGKSDANSKAPTTAELSVGKSDPCIDDEGDTRPLAGYAKLEME